MAGFIEIVRDQVDEIINDINDDDKFQKMLSKSPSARFAYNLGMAHGQFQVKIDIGITRFLNWCLRRRALFKKV